jgi:hypothetical protein
LEEGSLQAQSDSESTLEVCAGRTFIANRMKKKVTTIKKIAVAVKSFKYGTSP